MQRSYQKTRRELRGERQACLLFKRGRVFKTTWQSCEGLGLNYDEYYEKVIACMLSKSSIHNWH